MRWRADLVMFENFWQFRARLVLHGGRIVAAEGRLTMPARSEPAPVARLQRSTRLGPLPETFPRVAGRMDALARAARELGVRLPYPFLTPSFVTLAVIPHLKLTDRGLVDVDLGRIVPLWVDAQEGVP